jgi:hypothetical protein
VHRKDHGEVPAHLGEARHRVEEQGPVDERRAVERDEQVTGRLEPQARCGVPLADPLLQRYERVDHRVADEAHPPLVDALGAQVLDRLVAVQEADSREMVGDEAVDLLGHRPIEAP